MSLFDPFCHPRLPNSLTSLYSSGCFALAWFTMPLEFSLLLAVPVLPLEMVVGQAPTRHFTWEGEDGLA